MADFWGLPTGVLDNGVVRIEYLATAGPRIVRLFPAGYTQNLLAEVPNWYWETPYGPFRPYGGHRFWHAPESMPHTYFPDNEGLQVEGLPDGVRLSGPPDSIAGLAKCLEVRLRPGRPALTLRHILHNRGSAPLKVAPWAITQLPLGGVALLPQPVPPAGGGLLPNRHLVLWPYSRWNDERLRLDDEMICVQARPQEPPLKVGYLNDCGWLAYLRAGVLFVKRFGRPEERLYPDRNCNAELYCDGRVIELETLGPLVRLDPGRSVRHDEEWEIYTDPQHFPAEVRRGLARCEDGRLSA